MIRRFRDSLETWTNPPLIDDESQSWPAMKLGSPVVVEARTHAQAGIGRAAQAAPCSAPGLVFLSVCDWNWIRLGSSTLWPKKPNSKKKVTRCQEKE